VSEWDLPFGYFNLSSVFLHLCHVFRPQKGQKTITGNIRNKNYDAGMSLIFVICDGKCHDLLVPEMLRISAKGSTSWLVMNLMALLQSGQRAAFLLRDTAWKQRDTSCSIS
jgi:hypothetical protein